MNMNMDLLLKIFSVVFTTLSYIQSSLSFGMGSMGDINGFMLAKRGETDNRRLFFKGKPLQEVTYVTRHEDVRLECEVGGSPSPTIHWLKNGVRIPQGLAEEISDDEAIYEEKENPEGQPMLRLGKVKSRLFLDCVSDRVEAEYTCVAETPYERITQSTFLKMDNSLTLQSKAKCITKKAFRGEPARIHLWTAVRLEYEGASVQLFCRSEGYPSPTCSWRYSQFGEPIKNDGIHQLLPNGDLLINDINWMDNMGEYFCTCKNRAGRDEVATFLYPTEP